MARVQAEQEDNWTIVFFPFIKLKYNHVLKLCFMLDK